MANKGITVKVRISGVRETIRAFRDLPKDANNELRQRSQEIARDLAGKIAAAARTDSRQSALVAPTVKAMKDRVPVVQAGGNRKVGRNRKPAHKVLFGANFGATYLRQFRPHRGAGQDDYFFFSTVEANEGAIDRQWNAAADEIISRWGSGGAREVDV